MHGFIDNVHGYQVLDPYIQGGLGEMIMKALLYAIYLDNVRLLGTMVEREPV